MKEIFLNEIRDRNLPIEAFRKATGHLAQLMAEEIEAKNPILIPILRAGLVLVDAFQNKFTTAPIGLIGIQRDERTAQPTLYYKKVPRIAEDNHLLILDPMLATGGSASLTLQILKNLGGKQFTLISIVSAPEGINRIKKDHPDVGLYTVAIDAGLNNDKFIVPGLGDFGDRYFGTVD